MLARVRMSRVTMLALVQLVQRPRRAPAMSSQTGWPDGASAECGSDKPSASPTTCEVAAVPRNWQPPPGEPQARQPRSAASDKRDHAVRETGARGFAPCRRLRRGSAASVTPPGTTTHGRSRRPASAIIIAGSPLSQVAMPSTPGARGSDRASRRKTIAASLRYGRLSNMPGRALRPAVARIGTEPGERNGLQPRGIPRRRLHQQADFPMAGVIAERDGLAVRRAQPALGAQDQKLLAPDFGGIPAHAGVLRQAKQIAARAVQQHLLRQRQAARRPGPCVWRR